MLYEWRNWFLYQKKCSTTLVSSLANVSCPYLLHKVYIHTYFHKLRLYFTHVPSFLSTEKRIYFLSKAFSLKIKSNIYKTSEIQFCQTSKFHNWLKTWIWRLVFCPVFWTFMVPVLEPSIVHIWLHYFSIQITL